MTPQIKDMIAEEVKRQIALTNQEATVTAANNVPDPASSGIARMLSDNVQHVFVAGADLDVIDAGGTECAVSEGDALQLAGAPPADATAANLVVLSSKGGKECHKGATVSVALTDLQDMQNHMRETIDPGMGDLQAKGRPGRTAGSSRVGQSCTGEGRLHSRCAAARSECRGGNRQAGRGSGQGGAGSGRRSTGGWRSVGRSSRAGRAARGNQPRPDHRPGDGDPRTAEDRGRPRQQEDLCV